MCCVAHPIHSDTRNHQQVHRKRGPKVPIGPDSCFEYSDLLFRLDAASEKCEHLLTISLSFRPFFVCLSPPQIHTAAGHGISSCAGHRRWQIAAFGNRVQALTDWTFQVSTPSPSMNGYKLINIDFCSHFEQPRRQPFIWQWWADKSVAALVWRWHFCQHSEKFVIISMFYSKHSMQLKIDDEPDTGRERTVRAKMRVNKQNVWTRPFRIRSTFIG